MLLEGHRSTQKTKIGLPLRILPTRTSASPEPKRNEAPTISLEEFEKYVQSCRGCLEPKDYCQCKASPNFEEEKIPRTFETGATRDTDDGKLDYEGFLSPLVLQRYAEFMHTHRFQSDGELRDSDNWQKGIPQKEYMKSGWRHFMAWYLLHRDYDADETLEEALCALIFNASGYLHELLRADDSR
jgi:hypothetical protein